MGCGMSRPKRGQVASRTGDGVALHRRDPATMSPKQQRKAVLAAANAPKPPPTASTGAMRGRRPPPAFAASNLPVLGKINPSRVKQAATAPKLAIIPDDEAWPAAMSAGTRQDQLAWAEEQHQEASRVAQLVVDGNIEEAKRYASLKGLDVQARYMRKACGDSEDGLWIFDQLFAADGTFK